MSFETFWALFWPAAFVLAAIMAELAMKSARDWERSSNEWRDMAAKAIAECVILRAASPSPNLVDAQSPHDPSRMSGPLGEQS